MLATHSLCAAVNYYSLGVEAFNQVKQTSVMAHADEFETSLYLHLAPERIRMDRAVAGNDVVGRYMSSDSTSPFVRFNDYWGRWTRTVVHGDPTAATAEKGKVIWEAVLSRLIELVDEFRDWPIAQRSDQHENPVQAHIQW